MNENNEKNKKRELKGKAIILLATGALLVVLLIAGTAAWWTRVSMVNQMTMKAANFDFKSNYSDASFIIQAKDFINIFDDENQKAAPGTAGVIPIVINAPDSDIEVAYSININTDGMDGAFKRRLRFFKIKANDKGIPVDEEGNVIVDGEGKLLPGKTPVEYTLTSEKPIKGIVEPHEENIEYIYWEWVYDLNDKIYYKDGNWYIGNASAFTYSEEDKLDFDELDTGIATHKYDLTFPKSDGSGDYEREEITVYTDDGPQKVEILAYQKAMLTKLDVTGVAAEPNYDVTPGARQNVKGVLGSAYFDLGALINLHNTQRGITGS